MLSESADSGVQAVAFGAVAGDDQRRGRGQLGEGVEENVEAFDGLEPADEADARPCAARDFHGLHFCKPLFVDAKWDHVHRLMSKALGTQDGHHVVVGHVRSVRMLQNHLFDPTIRPAPLAVDVDRRIKHEGRAGRQQVAQNQRLECHQAERLFVQVDHVGLCCPQRRDQAGEVEVPRAVAREDRPADTPRRRRRHLDAPAFLEPPGRGEQGHFDAGLAAQRLDPAPIRHRHGVVGNAQYFEFA